MFLLHPVLSAAIVLFWKVRSLLNSEQRKKTKVDTKSNKISGNHNTDIRSNNSSPSNYMLRSRRKKSFELPAKPEVEVSFFDSLNLKRNLFTESSIADQDNTSVTGNSKLSKEIPNEASIKETSKHNGPEIRFKFTKCFDFEEKLKNKYNTANIDDINYEELDFESMGADYYESDYGGDDMTDQVSDEYSFDENHLEEEKNINVKYIIEEVLSEAKEVFTLVFNFCKTTHDKFNFPDLNKNEILKDAKETHSIIMKICSTLQSIKEREESNSENSLRQILTRHTSALKCTTTEEQLLQYRKIITRYLEEGDMLKESIGLIIEAIED